MTLTAVITNDSTATSDLSSIDRSRRPNVLTDADRSHRVPALPVLDEVVRRWESRPSRLVLVTHLLDTAVPYVRAMARAFDLEQVVAVPYSAQETARAQLADLPVHVPTTVEEVRDVAVESAARAARHGTVIVQEVGGQCAPAAGELAAAGLRGAVEDTTQGQWAYEAQQPLPLPIFTIADSPLKGLENLQVGRSIAASADRLVRTHFKVLLAERRVLVLGYGGVGTALVHHLRRYDASVSVWDPDPVARARAMMHGVRIGGRAELLSQADVIVGVSGRRSLTEQDVGLLRDGVILISGSSKQVEFGNPAMASAEIHSTPDVTELRYPDRTVFVLNNGHPVNFLDQSVLGRVLDLVYAELYLCTQQLAERAWPAGMWRLDRRLQHELAELWLDRYRTC